MKRSFTTMRKYQYSLKHLLQLSFAFKILHWFLSDLNLDIKAIMFSAFLWEVPFLFQYFSYTWVIQDYVATFYSCINKTKTKS